MDARTADARAKNSEGPGRRSKMVCAKPWWPVWIGLVAVAALAQGETADTAPVSKPAAKAGRTDTRPTKMTFTVRGMT